MEVPVLPPRKRTVHSTPSNHSHIIPASIPEESPPPIPPHRDDVRSFLFSPPAAAPRKPSLTKAATGDSIDYSLPLEEQPWFWGELSREESNELMRDRPSGTFLVRNSSVLGDFTLTLRKDNSNKLIKIYNREGKYGFSLTEPLRFATVPELVDFYRHHSLKQYNRNLDIMLLFPLTRGVLGEEEENLRHENTEKLTQDLRRFHADYLRKSRLYDMTFDRYAETAEELQEKQQNLLAFAETLKMFQNQLALIETFEPEAHEKRKVHENMSLIQSRCENLCEHKAVLEEEIKKCSMDHKRLEREVNAIKPDLLRLYRRRDRYQSLLLRKGMSETALQEELKEIELELEKEIEEGVKETSSACKEEQADYCVEDRVPPPSSPVAEDLSDVEGDGKWAPDSWLMSASCTKALATSLLQGRPTGTFLIRPSSSRQGFYALSIVSGGVVHHCLIEYKRGVGYCFAETKCFFPSLVEFVAHYSSNSLRDHNPVIDTQLNLPLNSPLPPSS